MLDKVNGVMYDEKSMPHLDILAPILLDICQGMVYLHSRNIVHGGTGGGGAAAVLWFCEISFPIKAVTNFYYLFRGGGGDLCFTHHSYFICSHSSLLQLSSSWF